MTGGLYFEATEATEADSLNQFAAAPRSLRPADSAESGKDVMPERVVTNKVLCYVVRDGRLLVFRHTDYTFEEVGIQVPAGSVRSGETPEDAALREAREETGLTDFTIIRKLGETEYDISPYQFEIQRRHVFHMKLTEPTPERWTSHENHDEKSEPTHFECFWIPLETAHVLQSGQGALLGRLFG